MGGDAEGSIRFGIVTPTLNADRFFDATLRSIWDQAGDGIEIDHVVVDGGSTDRTLEIAARYPSRILDSRDDQGMYDAINKGMAVVGGEFLGYINADDELAPGALRTVAEAFRRHPEASWLCGRLRYTDAEGASLGEMKPVPMTLTSFVGLGWCPIAQQTMWVRRSFFEDVGPFDVGFRNCGDYDWIARALAKEHPLILDQTLGTWRIHEEMLSFDAEKMARESRMVRDRNGHGGVGEYLMGKLLSLRLNASNPRWLVAKKTGKIRFTR